ncbi:MAG: MBL fold metallo-hydrolase [Planctomycetota bacterium]|nr:MBL fold metallo-hydrolase [Planctomycetota bacterium]
MLDIEWLGHACFRLNGSRTVYFDPYQLKDPRKPADIILCSHNHFDHFSVEDIRKIATSETHIFLTPDCMGAVPGIRHEVKPGDSHEVLGVKVRTVPAYNVSKKFHPKENRWVGYLVTMDGQTVYHTGDSDFIPEMKGLEADVALLPVSGTYVMTAEEAAEAFRAMKVKRAIPMHYGAIVGGKADADRFLDLIGRPG